MAPKKTKPVAKGRHLMKLSEESGWGTLDDSKAQDYGPDAWEPDERFQRENIFSEPTQRRSSEQLRLGPSQSTPTAYQDMAWEATNAPCDELCLLVFLTPTRLEFIVEKECEKLWKTVPLLRPGRVVVTISTDDELRLSRFLRPILGCQVVVKEYIGFLDESFSEREFAEFLKSEAQGLPWTGPLYALCTLTSNSASCDPYQDFQTWFPKPSFRVRAVHTDFERPWSQLVCNSFAQGIIKAFHWDQQSVSPDIDIVLEISDDLVTVLIDLKPCDVMDPCLSPFQPLLNPGVVCTVLHFAAPQIGDIVLNGTCGLLDTSSEIVQTYPEVHTIVGSDRAEDVEEAMQRGNLWEEKKHVEGCIFEMETLPYRENSIDVVIEYMPSIGTARDGGNRRPFSRRLKEIARVCRLGTGRVVLLARSESFVEGLLSKGALWSTRNKISTVFGSLQCTLFYMQRNNTPISKEYFLADYPSQSQAYALGRGLPTSRSRRHRAGRPSTRPNPTTMS